MGRQRAAARPQPKAGAGSTVDRTFPGRGRGGEEDTLTPSARRLINSAPGSIWGNEQNVFKDSRSSQRPGLEAGAFRRGGPAGWVPQYSSRGMTRCRCPGPLQQGREPWRLKREAGGLGGVGRYPSAGAMAQLGVGGATAIQHVRTWVPCSRRGGRSARRASPVAHSGSGDPSPSITGSWWAAACRPLQPWASHPPSLSLFFLVHTMGTSTAPLRRVELLHTKRLFREPRAPTPA